MFGKPAYEVRQQGVGHVARYLALGLVLVTLGIGVTSAQARPPSHVSSPVNFSFQDDYLTDLCGFPVVQSYDGVFKTTLLYDRAGNITSEVDTQPGFTLSFSSPASGKSFSWPFSGILRTDYTNGGVVGSKATAYGSGLSIKAPGVSAEASRAVFDAVVFDVTPEGIPLVAFTDVISVKGHFNDPGALDAAICAALAP